MVNDKNGFDWTNAKLKDNYTGLCGERQKSLIRTFYELGVWSAADVTGLGAVKKG